MILRSLIAGTRLHFIEWTGLLLAFIGFVYLVLPGVNAPSILGFFLMAIAGISWGLYTLKGRESKNPLNDTAYNFFRTTPLVLLMAIFTISNAHYSVEGILLAVLSGGLMSGIGYTLWYIALGGLSSIQAAVLQLLVPVIAALGGVLFVAEDLSVRLIISATLVLLGILFVILGKRYFSQNNNKTD